MSNRSLAARALLTGTTFAGLVALSVLQWRPLAHANDLAAPAPAPVTDQSAPQPGTLHKATFAGGCFWGVQAVFQHVRGVQSAVSGYAGGAEGTAQYEVVSTGATGHAESVQVTYDPAKVSYATLLQVFFTVALDPTLVDRQGPDVGTQYRSEIWTHDEEQARVARAYIAQLDAAHVFHAPIATRVDPLVAFYPAERYHQDYLTLHPDQPYIAINDMPKVRALQSMFPDLYEAKPVTVYPLPSAS